MAEISHAVGHDQARISTGFAKYTMKKKQGQEQHRIQVDYVDWVVSTGTMYTVLCQGEPMQVRKEHALKTDVKYLPNMFCQPGSAQRLATKMNNMFMTTDFTVAEVAIKTPH